MAIYWVPSYYLKPMWTYCQLNPKEQNSVEFDENTKISIVEMEMELPQSSFKPKHAGTELSRFC